MQLVDDLKVALNNYYCNSKQLYFYPQNGFIFSLNVFFCFTLGVFALIHSTLPRRHSEWFHWIINFDSSLQIDFIRPYGERIHPKGIWNFNIITIFFLIFQLNFFCWRKSRAIQNKFQFFFFFWNHFISKMCVCKQFIMCAYVLLHI